MFASLTNLWTPESVLIVIAPEEYVKYLRKTRERIVKVKQVYRDIRGWTSTEIGDILLWRDAIFNISRFSAVDPITQLKYNQSEWDVRKKKKN